MLNTNCLRLKQVLNKNKCLCRTPVLRKTTRSVIAKNQEASQSDGISVRCQVLEESQSCSLAKVRSVGIFLCVEKKHFRPPQRKYKQQVDAKCVSEFEEVIRCAAHLNHVIERRVHLRITIFYISYQICCILSSPFMHFSFLRGSAPNPLKNKTRVFGFAPGFWRLGLPVVFRIRRATLNCGSQ